MATALFIVIQSRGKWWVDFEGRSHGPHDTIESAALEARKQAMFQAGLGRPSEVLVPDGSGKYWTVWNSRKAAQTAPEPQALPRKKAADTQSDPQRTAA